MRDFTPLYFNSVNSSFLSTLPCNQIRDNYKDKVPTIDQETAIPSSEPMETLVTFRSDKVLRPTRKQQGRVYFGQNMVCVDSLSEGKGKMIKVGDPVYVMKVVPSCADAAA
ncbi:hypothetical protein Acr_04g0002360 [Actinidia rufa]|uniref:Uncharacterized protein n=1 Tax=Actinidia rufa TaxID=165716 RepID=A0A7J0EG95_9ERIC|nr:hypothetical protein Acr_04g0002360 [Actinidia rufa]